MLLNFLCYFFLLNPRDKSTLLDSRPVSQCFRREKRSYGFQIMERERYLVIYLLTSHKAYLSEYIFYGLDNSEQLLEINSVIVQEWIPVDLIY